MPESPTFDCQNASCGKASRYRHPVTATLADLRITENEETRKYRCEHCHALNEITFNRHKWVYIDSLST